MLTTKRKIALARVVQAPVLSVLQLTGMGPEAYVRRRAINWCLDLREGIDFSIFLLGAFEPSTLAAYTKIIRPGMTVLDIGANSGSHTLHMARLVGDLGHVFAFEPTKWALDKLQANIDQNPTLGPQISVFQTVLSDDDNAELPETIHSSWPLAPAPDLHPQLRARSMTTKGAIVRTLDSVVDEMDMPKVGFVKLDVDGYECQVLGGMTKMLVEHKPPILMEFSPYGLEEKGGSLSNLVEILASAGYELFRLGQTEPMPMDISVLQNYAIEGGGFNVIARSTIS